MSTPTTEDRPNDRATHANDRFEHALGEFIATCEAQRTLIGHAPVIEALDERSRPKLLAREFTRVTKGFSDEDRVQTQGLLDEYLAARRLARAAERGDAESEPVTRDIPKAGSIPTQPRESGREEVSESVAHAMNALARFMFLHDHSPPKLPLYLSSLLTTHVASVETLMGHLLGAFYWVHPEALTSGKSLPLSALHEFGSIDEALESVIADEVESFRRGGLEDWAEWFAKYAKLQFPDYSMDNDALVETFSRRNAIVHNDARASKQYLNISGAIVAEGSTLLPDADYLLQVNDSLLVFGVLLGTGLWRKLLTSSGGRANVWAADLAFELMVADRWLAAEAVSRLAREKLKPSAAAATVHRFNQWLAVKRQNGTEAIRREIEEFDLSALHPRFAVAVAALLDDQDELKKLIPDALDARYIGMWDVHNWPVFKEFRETPVYAELMATREPWRSSRRPPPKKRPGPAQRKRRGSADNGTKA